MEVIKGSTTILRLNARVFLRFRLPILPYSSAAFKKFFFRFFFAYYLAVVLVRPFLNLKIDVNIPKRSI